MKSFAIKFWGFQAPHIMDNLGRYVKEKEIEKELHAKIVEENPLLDYEAAEKEFANYYRIAGREI